jgi:hypothetical protein
MSDFFNTIKGQKFTNAIIDLPSKIDSINNTLNEISTKLDILTESLKKYEEDLNHESNISSSITNEERS